MDFDPYAQMAEETAFEDEYAAEMEMLNEVEQEASSTKQMPDEEQIVSSQRRRRLFEDSQAEPSTSGIHNFSHDEYFGGELFIDEEPEDVPVPDAKRRKMDYIPKSKHSLPTTLDDDFDEMRRRYEKKNDHLDPEKMIQKILQFRNRKDGDSEEFLQQGATNGNMKDGLKIRKVLPFPPIHSDFISATSTDGQRCYMRIRNLPNSLKKSELTGVMRVVSLLPQSVSEMRQEIQIESDNKTLREAHVLTEKIRKKNIDGDVSNVPVENAAESASESFADVPDAQKFDENFVDDDDAETLQNSSGKELWLDKFAPTQYTHLLSDENVNRSLLKWLKMWDFVVFGRKMKKKEKPQQSGFPNKKNNFKPKWEFDERTDEYDRPFFKAALLHGPPGLGKTTLAHIIAKHAGYHVVEMNASDDRSSEVFRNKLRETTEMKSVLGEDERPNCLIIDEIDGAPQAAIDVLLSAMNKTRNTTEKKVGKRKKSANNILLRPIICICNDLYVPSLRQLRQNSFVINFPPTRPAILASRLAQLCRLQSLQCDTTTLLKLCEKTDNDIRSCVNMLQFVRSSGQEKLSVDTVKSFQIGQKDQHKGMFKIWQEIFQLPKSKRATEKTLQSLQSFNQSEGIKSTNIATRFYNIHHLVSANGDYEKTLQGVYENFLNMKFKDHNLSSINKAQEWLQFYDQLSHVNQHLQDWSVMKFYPYLFVVFHMLFSCINVPKFTFPTQSFENSKKLQKSLNLLSGMFLEMMPQVRCYTSSHTAVVDSVPYILSIMSPVLRPVNLQLYTIEEKKMLESLVSTMLSYNLSYRQVRNDDGQYEYVLEPNVSEVCSFLDSKEKAKLPYSTRQLIAKEVELERMRRSEIVASEPSPKIPPPKPQNAEKEPPKRKEIKTLEKSLSDAQIPAEKPVIDFFSRFTKTKKVVTTAQSESNTKKPMRDPGIGNSQIWYKFNEGFSNAVRQTVYVKDFL